jgi:hypothetical protein
VRVRRVRSSPRAVVDRYIPRVSAERFFWRVLDFSTWHFRADEARVIEAATTCARRERAETRFLGASQRQSAVRTFPDAVEDARASLPEPRCTTFFQALC